MPENTLYYGDNLEVMRKYLPDECIDLVYLDPPFNSNRDYNLLFREQSGEPAQGQIKAFTDTWQWSEGAYDEFCQTCPKPALVELVQGFVRTLGRNDLTAYLVMMAPRLVELHRVLKPTGSLYLHCDPTASHYLKVMLDVVFGARNFMNEIAWKRYAAHSLSQGRYDRISDRILFYCKDSRLTRTFDPPTEALSEEEINERFPHVEPETGRRFQHVSLEQSSNKSSAGETRIIQGRTVVSEIGWRWSQETFDQRLKENPYLIYWTSTGRPRYKIYADEYKGKPVGDIWTDVPYLSSGDAERLGYPTQKPLALLERILQASSNEGDTVLDPFCGCGTAIVAAQKLNRRWIGIDITHLAIALIKYRLSDMFDLKEGKDYRVVGEPTTVAEARALAQQDRDEFQKWALGLIPRARPYQDKKGKDTGIDGVLFFKDDLKDPKRALIQVKSGRVSVKDVRDFRGVLEREGATLGLFVTLEPPTRDMVQEAEQAGFYTTPLGNLRIPRLQIRTVEELLAGTGFAIPSAALLMGVAQAERVSPSGEQGALEM
jgi:site-specific DNA-methyltransferase (adenine-specific)